jgi:hypothetical protein
MLAQGCRDRLCQGERKTRRAHLHGQGLALVQFSAQLSASYGIGVALRGWLRECLGGFRGRQGACRVYFVSETVQV